MYHSYLEESFFSCFCIVCGSHVAEKFSYVISISYIKHLSSIQKHQKADRGALRDSVDTVSKNIFLLFCPWATFFPYISNPKQKRWKRCSLHFGPITLVAQGPIKSASFGLVYLFICLIIYLLIYLFLSIHLYIYLFIYSANY